jgi:RNA polymerase sigma-70 factor (sigma-E family)
MRRQSADTEFTEFVASRWNSLFRTAYLMLGDHALAEDLVQTALAKAYVSWKSIKAREAVDAYVMRILVTTAMSWWRKKSWRNERPTVELPEQLIDSAADALTQRDWIWHEIQKLPARQRAVVVLRYYEDYTERQIADAMNCSTGTVKSQSHDALAALRVSLGDDVIPQLTEGSR